VTEDSSDNFYGATCEGGSNDDGVLFNISRPGFSFLTFLLLNKTELTASINSVFDHSMFIGQRKKQRGYCADEAVTV
jgi:hypothetical protein